MLIHLVTIDFHTILVHARLRSRVDQIALLVVTIAFVAIGVLDKVPILVKAGLQLILLLVLFDYRSPAGSGGFRHGFWANDMERCMLYLVRVLLGGPGGGRMQGVEHIVVETSLLAVIHQGVPRINDLLLLPVPTQQHVHERRNGFRHIHGLENLFMKPLDQRRVHLPFVLLVRLVGSVVCVCMSHLTHLYIFLFGQ